MMMVLARVLIRTVINIYLLINNVTYIGIELPDKAREVAMLEKCWEEITGKFRRLPHHEGRPFHVPRYHIVCHRILHKHVGLEQERWWA